MGPEIAEGVIVAGRFRLERCIGEGGMGVVWAATNTNTLRRVALKVLKGDRASDVRVRRRFLREGRAASAVRHPNVVEILDVLELEDGSPTMVMELLEGETLGQRLRRERPLPLGEVAAILLPAISAVGTAHALGIVHRDLKPDNIFLARGADGMVTVKVLDFGIAKMNSPEGDPAQTEGLTGTGAMLGTPYYMSPEQVFAEDVIDYRSDIWALGVILYECLSGVRPTQAENFGQIMKIIATGAIVPLGELVPEVPVETQDLVRRMLSSQKSARPQTLQEVRDILTAHSHVPIVTFGDPVLAPVRASLDASSSGEHGLSSSQALARSKVDKDAVTRNDPSATTKVEGKGEVLSSTRDPATETQGGLGSTFSGPRRPARRRWLAMGVALAVVASVLGSWRAFRSAPVDAVAASSVPGVEARVVVATEGATSGFASASPSAHGPEVVVATTSDASTATELPSASAAPRAAATSHLRPDSAPTHAKPPATARHDGTPALAASAASGTGQGTPGGLVDKPPF